MPNNSEQIRIVQETVCGKEITFAHIMGGPAPVIYQKIARNQHKHIYAEISPHFDEIPPESRYRQCLGIKMKPAMCGKMADDD